MGCKLCEYAKGKKCRKLYEDAISMVVLSEEPATLGHVIAFPKKHFDRFEDLDSETAIQLYYIASYSSTAVFESLGAHGTNIILNSGIDTDSHAAIHILPRKEDDGIDFKWTPKKMEQDVLKEIAAKIKDETFFIGKKPDDNEAKAVVDAKEKDIKKIKASKDEEDYLLRQINRIP